MREDLTASQLAELDALDDEALLSRACAALHALNRRAKHLRDHANAGALGRADRERDLFDAIYALKTRFLDALVRARRARVEHFDERIVRTDARGETTGLQRARWYVVSVDDYRWHVPDTSATPAIRRASRRGEAHASRQPAREIPDVGLTLEAQLGCVEAAVARLQRSGPARPG